MISITNAGRGSGKTHDLIEWAKKAPNRYVIGTHACTGDQMENAGLAKQFVHATQAKHFFQGRQGYEVAIDNFHLFLPGILQAEYGIHYETDVIITSTLPEASMGKTSSIPIEDVITTSVEYIQNLKNIFEGKK
jgi:hypothetical protein